MTVHRIYLTNFWSFICFRPSRTMMTWRTMCPSMLAGPMILWPSFSRKWVYIYICIWNIELWIDNNITLFYHISTHKFLVAILSFKFSRTISLFLSFFFFFLFWTYLIRSRWYIRIDDRNSVKIVNKIEVIEIDFFSSGEINIR